MITFERVLTPPEQTGADVIVVGAHTGAQLSPAAADLDGLLGGGLSAHLKATQFKGKLGDTSLMPTLGRIAVPYLLVVGLGAAPPSGTDTSEGALEEVNSRHDQLRRAAGVAARRTGHFAVVALALGPPQAGGPEPGSPHRAAPGAAGDAQAIVEGYLLGAYSFDRYKSSPTARATERVLVLGEATDEDLRRGQVIAQATNWARDIINEPAGARGPATFASLAATRAEAAGLRVEILDETELEARGMHGILGVGQASKSPPRLLLLHYEPPGAHGFVGAVGKGITFDSGGLSLKPAESMETMKTDCSGAAAVVAAMCALPALGPRIKVTAATPLAENMPGGGAIKPGDVIRHYGGRTSEVMNTDAEGRLVLADTLAWMAEQKPDAMIDFATLTGAMVVALGKKVAGFFATTPALAAEVTGAAAATGERVWQMPLLDDLQAQGDSEIADIKNIGTRWGGAIFAALFLRDFAGDIPWIHVDIAGPARSDEAEFYLPKGPTGMGTRLLIEWIEQRAGRP